MVGFLPTKFVCINCREPTILKKLHATETCEIIGVQICICKGDPKSIPKKESNIIPFSLEKEKRYQLKKDRKK